MRNTIIISVGLFIAVIAASIFYFSDLSADKTAAEKTFALLPENTLLITSFTNDETTDNIFKDFEVFDAILGFDQKAKLDHLKQTLLRSQLLNEYVQGTDVFVSFHQVDGGIQSLISVPSLSKLGRDEANQLLQSIHTTYQIASKDTLGLQLYTIADTSGAILLHTLYHNDVFFASESLPLLVQVTDKTVAKISEKTADYFLQKTNRNVPLNVYFNHESIDSLPQHLLRNKPGDFLTIFRDIAGYSAWNINYKQDALMLNGESEIENKQSYLALFSRQNKAKQGLHKYFPSTTAMYLEFALSDVSRFRKELKSVYAQDGQPAKEQFTRVEKQHQKALATMDSLLTGGFAKVELNNGDYLGFASISSREDLLQHVRGFATPAQDSTFRMDHSNLLLPLYGEAFSVFQRPYFIVVNDVIVLANSVRALQNFTNSWSRQDLLNGTLGYKNFERLHGDEANVTYFIQTKNANNLLKNRLSKAYADRINDTEHYGYQDFYSWSFQLTGNAGEFISSVYGLYKSSNALGASADWTYQFNHRLITRPYVFEHSDTTKFIIAQEQDHTVHAIHPNGSKMWSTVFSGRVVGDMTQMRDRSIVLVTDRNRLYRFDPEGMGYPGFSTTLPQKPTGTPVVLEVDSKDYILIPASDELLAYDLAGNPMTDWSFAPVSGQLLDGIYSAEGKIVVGSTAGILYYINKDGSVWKETESPDSTTFTGQLGMLAQGEQTLFLATDRQGHVYRMAHDVLQQAFDIPEWNSGAKSYFHNIAETDLPELITVDGANIRVYSVQDSVSKRFQYNFTKEISDDPLFFPINSRQSQLGIGARANNLVYVFNETGAITSGFPMEALPLFYYGKINYNSANYVLCSRRDHKLYAYKE